MNHGQRNNAIGSGYGRRAEMAHSTAFEYSNTKMEPDEDDDAFAEPDSGSPYEQSSTRISTWQTADAGNGPINGRIDAGITAKRKRPLKLTASQRERKRAIDREAQRSIRIKTKNYIAHLVSLVKVMEETDVTGQDGQNNRTRELMNQLRQSQEEIRKLRETMLGVQRLLGSGLGHQAAERSAHQVSNSGSPVSTSENLLGPSISITAASDESTHAWADPVRSNDQSSTTTETTHPVISHPDVPDRPDRDPAKRKFEGEMFYYAEWHLNRVHTAGATAFDNQFFDEDIAVRAIIEGWLAIEERYELDLGWHALREVDQVVFPEAGVVERIAAMRLMRMVLLNQVNNKASNAVMLPSHMTKEVADLGIHPEIIDHFVWPGFRQELARRPERYITNAFNEKYRRNLKFLWPYEISDTYHLNPMTQLYECTPEFAQRHVDIRCWTLKRSFFEGHEELLQLIPTFETPLTKSLPPPRTSSFAEQAAMAMVDESDRQDTERMPTAPKSLPTVALHLPAAQQPIAQHAADMAQWQHVHNLQSQCREQPFVYAQPAGYWQAETGQHALYDGRVTNPHAGQYHPHM